MFEKKIKQDYLKLAQIIYGGEFYNELKNYKIKEVNLYNSKIKKVQDSIMSRKGISDFYSYKNEETGFVANLFENTETKELVIAYRGTERIGLGENVSDLNTFIKDIKTDINVMTGVKDGQFQDAWEFYKSVREQNTKRKIVITGQSLGGALAQITAAKEYTINREKVETYTYNAPGCSHLLYIYDCNAKYRYSFINNYSVMNDWCGMFGQHIGTRYLILPVEIKEISNKSTGAILNNILLTTHEGIFDYTEEKMGKIIRKPNDFNQREGLSLWYFDHNNPIKNYKNISGFIDFNMPHFKISEDLKNNSFIKKTKKFITENIKNEIQDSNVAVAIRTATSSFIQNQTENMNSWINNSTIGTATKILDSVIGELSFESLNNAKRILNRYNKHN